jgi:hypothetical protein
MLLGPIGPQRARQFALNLKVEESTGYWTNLIWTEAAEELAWYDGKMRLLH